MSEGNIYWHQGLFLQPQHFQISNRQLSDLLAPLGNYLRPYFWGVAKGEGINEAALAAGRLELGELSLLLPNNPKLLEFPQNAVCAGRQLSLETLPVDGRLTVYLGLRAYKPGEANVTVAESREAMAFAPTRLAVPVEPESVPDTYSNGPPAKIRRMSYVLNLVFDDELERVGDLDLLPIARLLRQGEKIIPDPTFIPPCLTISVSPALSALLEGLRDRVLGKAKQLEGYKNLAGQGAASGETTVLLLGLRVLSLYAARLEQAVANPCLSPWEAYGILKELVAELSVFSLEINPLGENRQEQPLVPPYAHHDLGPCFRAFQDLIIRLLEGISTGPRFVTRFEFHDPYWSAAIPSQIINETQSSGGEFWLVLGSATADPENLRDSALRMLKLSSTSGMGSLLVRALPGIPLAAADGPPVGLPRQSGTSYFRIGQESPLWQEVTKEGSISLFWPEAPADLDAQLVIIAR